MNNNEITIYQALNRREDAQNPRNFTEKYNIKLGDTASLERAIQFDNTTICYKNGYRSTQNYIQANCILADIDNSHSDKESEWITQQKLRDELCGIMFYYYPSRNHMKSKGEKSARPKFHCIFPTAVLTTPEQYKKTINSLHALFPQLHFDPAVSGAAQLNFGVAKPCATFVAGEINLTDYILSTSTKTFDKTPNTKAAGNLIFEGARHTTMLKIANKTLYKEGITQNAYQKFQEESHRCIPPLSETELRSIWHSAKKYYTEKVEKSSDYIAPASFRAIQNLTDWELPPKNQDAVQQLFSISKENKFYNIKIAKLILRATGIKVMQNDMTNQIEVMGLPDTYGDDNLIDTLAILINDTARKSFFRGSTTKTVHESLSVIAKENHYHPVISLLESKPWDNADRLTTIYEILNLDNDLHKTLIKKWAIQTIALLYNNCEESVSAEGVLVFQGKQGIGKTQFFRHLAIRESFFKGGVALDMTNKDCLMSATKVWICELGEIDGTTQKEQSALKAFLTEKTDRYREPYARCETKRLRRTSFCGTVNPKYYLRDETGNRRYWTIPIDHIDLKRVFSLSEEWYAQFWRQILTIYRSNPRGYLLNPQEKEFVNSNNLGYEQMINGEDEFLTYFNLAAPDDAWKWLSAAEIAELLNERYKSLRLPSQKVNSILDKVASNTQKTFQRKIINGKRLILCPPSNR